MANRVKEVSAFNGTSWGAAVPLGANDSNIDITSSTTQPDGSAVSGVTGDSATALNTSAVTVSEGDTGASAWTKFNRFRKRVANNFANYIQGSIATSYNATGSNSAVYSTNVLNNYMSNVIGYSGTATPSAGTVADQLSSLNDNTGTTSLTEFDTSLFEYVYICYNKKVVTIWTAVKKNNATGWNGGTLGLSSTYYPYYTVYGTYRIGAAADASKPFFSILQNNGSCQYYASQAFTAHIEITFTYTRI